MKKLIILFTVVLLASSCTCLIGQVPPQYILVGNDCQAALPDYRSMLTITDNCGIKDTIQTPEAGYILSAVNQSVEVTIRATDQFGNWSEVKFMVTAKDDKPPVMIPKDELLSAGWEVINSMYDQADRLLAEQEQYFDETFDWEAAGIPEDKRPIGEYDKKVLNIIVSPAHATTGYGHRMITFVSNADSYIAK